VPDKRRQYEGTVHQFDKALLVFQDSCAACYDDPVAK
jgi:hypothetical protein